jgi:hypothetical protein
MSAYGMKPHFIDQAGYMRWRKQWRIVHADISKNIRNQKRVCKEAQRVLGLPFKSSLPISVPWLSSLWGCCRRLRIGGNVSNPCMRRLPNKCPIFRWYWKIAHLWISTSIKDIMNFLSCPYGYVRRKVSRITFII